MAGFLMNDRISFLKKTDLFRGVPDDLLAQIGGQMETIRIPEGDVLMKEGEQGDLAFVIVDGEIRIEKGGVTIVKVGPGETVGEMRRIGSGSRSPSLPTIRTSTSNSVSV